MSLLGDKPLTEQQPQQALGGWWQSRGAGDMRGQASRCIKEEHENGENLCFHLLAVWKSNVPTIKRTIPMGWVISRNKITTSRKVSVLNFFLPVSPTAKVCYGKVYFIGLTKYKFIFLQFWTPEVWNQFVSKAGFLLEAGGEVRFLAFSRFWRPVFTGLWMSLPPFSRPTG